MSETIDLAHKRRVKEASNNSDCRFQLPEDILKEAIREIKEGIIKPSKMTIVCVDEDDNYTYYNANMCLRETLGLLDIIKDIMLRNS